MCRITSCSRNRQDIWWSTLGPCVIGPTLEASGKLRPFLLRTAVTLFRSFSLCLCLSISLSHSLSLYLPLSLSVSISLSHSLSLYLPLLLSLCLSVWLGPRSALIYACIFHAPLLFLFPSHFRWLFLCPLSISPPHLYQVTTLYPSLTSIFRLSIPTPSSPLSLSLPSPHPSPSPLPDPPVCPSCRHNLEKTFLIWINEEDQCRVISMQHGGDLKATFARFSRGLKEIEGLMKEHTAEVARRERLGFICTCPSNLGTGMRCSVHLQLHQLTKVCGKAYGARISDAYVHSPRGHLKSLWQSALLLDRQIDILFCNHQ